MHTRLAKAADFDAIVVAVAAFDRLGLAEHARRAPRPRCDGAPGRPGRLGGGVPGGRRGTSGGCSRRSSTSSAHRRVDAERAFLAELGGDCDLPAGALAVPDAGELRFHAVLASPDGSRLLRHHQSGSDADALGRDVARRLRAALEAPRRARADGGRGPERPCAALLQR